MKWYADESSKRTRQLLGDLGTAVWVVVWLVIGFVVRSGVLNAQTGTNKIQSGGADLSTRMTDAGNALTAIPVVGGGLQKPFTNAAKAATEVSQAGSTLSSAVSQLATLLSYTTVVTPIAVAVLVWVLIRVRYARRAGRARSLALLPGGKDLLALQALQHSAPQDLARISASADGWRRMNGLTIHRLAELELHNLGLRPPS